jgi:hypothetical protein
VDLQLPHKKQNASWRSFFMIWKKSKSESFQYLFSKPKEFELPK